MKKIMFCGGGSAGHVIPNIAIIEQLSDKAEVCYIGTGAIEKSICAENGIKFFQFEGVKFVRGKLFCNLKIPFKLNKSVAKCRKILEREKPDLLFCKGGYVSVPPAIAAKKLHIPVITHESDLSLGLANRLIAGWAVIVLTSFRSTARKLKNTTYVGTPMRQNLFNRDKLFSKARFGMDMRPTIIVLGGGNGSAKINLYIRKIAAEVCKKYNILHICGKGNMVFSNIYGYKQYEFISDMGAAYACADYAISRCGANTANELIALKIPTLFIPLENKRSRGDQIANADYFLTRGLCRVLKEKDLTESSLNANIEQLISDSQLKTALKLNDSERGNEKIIQQIFSVIN
jgi:UDP-N-acetylglucosamine--N-acetylmuramyl-(pentapeptide) pyrophosphoryl-undecaprenol N-acetylglucosamine transferase